MIKRIIQKFIRIAQKILIAISLLILYIVGFGITLILAIIFNRRILKTEYKSKETFWRNPEGYDPDINECLKPS